MGPSILGIIGHVILEFSQIVTCIGPTQNGKHLHTGMDRAKAHKATLLPQSYYQLMASGRGGVNVFNGKAKAVVMLHWMDLHFNHVGYPE